MGVVWFESSSSFSPSFTNVDESNDSYNGLTLLVAFVTSSLPWVLFAACASCAGACMGAVGVGGVLLVPSAVLVLHVKTQTAVASVAPAYLLASLSGMRAYRTTLQAPPLRHRVAPLALGAAVGGIVASVILPHLPAYTLKLVLAVVCILFGLHKLASIAIATVCRSNHEQDKDDNIIRGDNHDDDDVDDEKVIEVRQIHTQTETDNLLSLSPESSTVEKEEDFSSSPKRVCSTSSGCDVFLGAMVGFGSTLTGTSGPLLFLPAVFLASSSPCHEGQEISGTHAVALSQIIGAPMALCMTLGTLLCQKQQQQSNKNENDTTNSTVDIDLGISLLVGLVTGLCVPLGERGMRSLRRRLASGNSGRGGDGLVTALVSLVISGSGVYMLMAQLG